MKTMIRKPGAIRREEIAQAVLRIIGQRGLTKLTTTTIAAEVGITSGGLFRHFASRQEILSEAVRYGIAKIEATFPEDTLPPAERLCELARRRVHVLASEPGLAWLLRSEQAFLALPMEAVGWLAEIIKRSRLYVLTALREGAAEGTIRDDIEPEILSVTVMGTIHALIGMTGMRRRVASEGKEDPETVLNALMRMIEPLNRKV
jgi:AcrR family transcriptional regulator